MSVEFSAMGTTWWVDADVPVDEVPAQVRALERRLSRFLSDSSVGRLRVERSVDDPVLAAVVRRGLALSAATEGALAWTMGAELAAWGYRSGDVGWPQVDEGGIRGEIPRLTRGDAPDTPTTVTVDGDRVTLHGPGELDLGAIAKGWAVDAVHDALRAAGARWAWVDGGGDLRASGRPMTVGIPGGWALALDGAVATSSVQRRRWTTGDGREAWHVLDPRTGGPVNGRVVTATVVAPDCATADALATAMIVEPRLATRLLAWGAAALVQEADGAAWVTPGWPSESTN